MDVLKFIEEYEKKEEAEKIEGLAEVDIIDNLYNSNFNYIDIMEV